jgi:hypothetical protein
MSPHSMVVKSSKSYPYGERKRLARSLDSGGIAHDAQVCTAPKSILTTLIDVWGCSSAVLQAYICHHSTVILKLPIFQTQQLTPAYNFSIPLNLPVAVMTDTTSGIALNVLPSVLPNASSSTASMTTLAASSPVSNLQPPFTPDTEIHLSNVSSPNPAINNAKTDWKCLLPATYHSSSHGTMNVRSNIRRFVKDELDLSRLTEISGYLWLVGMKNNARALNRQAVMGRSIVPTEQMDMHLVWYDNTIFVKPLPAWLLSHSFWTEHLCRSHDAETEKLYGAALGFLVSYSWLVCSPNDFYMAKSLRLLPEQLTYEGWISFMDAITGPSISTLAMAPRYQFGELRLARLNTIYRYAPHLRLKHFVRGYFYLHHTYSSFFARRFSWIAVTVFAYITIVLSAMQVGMATTLGQNSAFSKSSEWFAVVSLALPPAVAILATILGAFFVLNNLWFTLAFLLKKRKERASHRVGQPQSQV